MVNFSAAVITISDTCSAGTATDLSGPALHDLLRDHFNPSEITYKIIPDDSSKIQTTLEFLVDALKVDVIITTGGTGFGPRDVTPEATKKVIDREAPQLALVMALYSLQKTKFAALSRAVCGIRKRSLIINMPGSKKAVVECFASIQEVLPHALQHMRNDTELIRQVHTALQKPHTSPNSTSSATKSNEQDTHLRHVCPHKTNSGDANDRNSIYPMVPVHEGIHTVLGSLNKRTSAEHVISGINLPPFRASMKDGYALRARGGPGVKQVIGYISAGDPIQSAEFNDAECFKINTGAPLPEHADCVIQVEDTELLTVSDDELRTERTILVKATPSVDLDIRPIGCDLQKGESLFRNNAFFPGSVTYNSMLASVGAISDLEELQIGVISTGDEIVEPGNSLKPGQIYDSNMTMLRELLKDFGFDRVKTIVAKDSYESLKTAMETLTAECVVTICTGGVSMGDKDFVKRVLTDLDFTIHFGRINMKPGKPMTFATNASKRAVFGLPGNPVSAFVTFHLFVLPALRFISNYAPDKWHLPRITVELLNDRLELDYRPEYARATVISKGGKLCAVITGDQISSRLKSIDGADVLLHLPARTDQQSALCKGTVLNASVLKLHFISQYE